MKCPECNETVIYDEASDTYYCENCKALYDYDDIMEPNQISILFISFLMWIPILNLLFLKIFKNRPREEQQTYTNIVLSSVMLYLVLALISTLVLRVIVNKLDTRYQKTFDETTTSLIEMFDNYDVSHTLPEPIQPIPEETSIDEIEEDVVLEYSKDLLEVFNGCTINGDSVLYLIDNYTNYGYLVQTTSMRRKNMSFQYFYNVGHLFAESEFDELLNLANIECSIYTGSFQMQDDIIGTDALRDDSKVSKIYGASRYSVNVLYDLDGNVTGLAFIELED